MTGDATSQTDLFAETEQVDKFVQLLQSLAALSRAGHDWLGPVEPESAGSFNVSAVIAVLEEFAAARATENTQAQKALSTEFTQTDEQAELDEQPLLNQLEQLQSRFDEQDQKREQIEAKLSSHHDALGDILADLQKIQTQLHEK